MIHTILQILEAGLSLWESREKDKYVKKFYKLQKELYEEESKPWDVRDGALIDNIHFELLSLGRAFAKAARQDSPDKS